MTGAAKELETTRSCPQCGETSDSPTDRCPHCGHDPSSTFVPHPGWRATIALAILTTVAMWAFAYVCRLPGIAAPGQVLLVLFVLCLLCGGGLAGAWTRSLAIGASAGGLACLLNLLILGSFLADNREQALTWVPGTIVLGAVLATIGAALGRMLPAGFPTPNNWNSVLVRVAALATLLLLAVGGIVTGAEAGLAVPDWPNSFTSNMFVYPLSRMTGGIYYEHAHRLFGSLVGLTTLVLATTVFVTDRRGWIRGLVVGLFVLVCVQGVLGGLRVTGGFTTSAAAEDLAPSLTLAVVHGVNGQVFFALLMALAAFVSTTWRKSPAKKQTGEEAESTINMTTWLVVLVLAQLILGAGVRHLDWDVTWHIALGVGVAVLAGLVGVRAASQHKDLPVLRQAGVAVVAVVALQFLLGVAALATTTDADSMLARFQVPVTTVHQTNGAVLLGCATLLAVWARRFLATGTGTQ